MPEDPTKPRRWTWMWVAVAAILVATGLFFTWVFVWGGHGPRAITPMQTPEPVARTNPAALPAITDYESILHTTRKADLVGRKVQLDNVTIGKVTPDKTFWIGNAGQELFVAVNGPGVTEAPNPNVAAGRTVDIVGTIKASPTANESRKAWNLDKGDARKVENEEVFVSADTVDPARITSSRADQPPARNR